MLEAYRSIAPGTGRDAAMIASTAAIKLRNDVGVDAEPVAVWLSGPRQGSLACPRRTAPPAGRSEMPPCRVNTKMTPA